MPALSAVGLSLADFTGTHSDDLGMGELAIPIPVKSAFAIFGVNGGDFRECPSCPSRGNRTRIYGASWNAWDG
jgi:hypothetical protein